MYISQLQMSMSESAYYRALFDFYWLHGLTQDQIFDIAPIEPKKWGWYLQDHRRMPHQKCFGDTNKQNMHALNEYLAKAIKQTQHVQTSAIASLNKQKTSKIKCCAYIINFLR